jgi:hypothetical protein
MANSNKFTINSSVHVAHTGTKEAAIATPRGELIDGVYGRGLRAAY